MGDLVTRLIVALGPIFMPAGALAQTPTPGNVPPAPAQRLPTTGANPATAVDDPAPGEKTPQQLIEERRARELERATRSICSNCGSR